MHCTGSMKKNNICIPDTPLTYLNLAENRKKTHFFKNE